MSIFVVLYALSFIADSVLIPKAHRQYYAGTADACTVVVNALWHLIPLAGWYGWRPRNESWQAVGVVLWAVGSGLLTWARVVNPWFTGAITQPRWIVTDGPYEFLRHPGYVGLSLMTIATVCLLQQWPMVPLASAYIAMLCWRIRRENQLLYA
jgi:protein-S-isoprenylcysteine O-methyltransferase Ste14